MQNDDAEDHAGVRIPPPIIYIAFLAAGILVDSPWINFQLASPTAMIAGVIICCAAGVLAWKTVPRHKREGSNIEPWKPTTLIFSDGVYGKSRNPIYLAMALLLAGIGVASGSIAALVFLFPCLLVIRYYVIAREEQYLERCFGQEYLDYKAKVRRWF